MSEIAILSVYCFVEINNLEILQPQILHLGKKKQIRGTILIAPEGFNGSISGNEEDVKWLLNQITVLTGAQDIMSKINYCIEQPFQKLKIRIKKEIITLGVGDLDIKNLKGDYIPTHEWSAFIARDDVITIDTRNDYEVKIGTFKNAIDPKIETFRQFPKWVEDNKDLLQGKKIAMFCTGGVRCEKSTAYLKQLGYTGVYHLEGGILQYLEDTANKEGAWQGKCFVFDDRIAVEDNLKPSEGCFLERKQPA